MFTEADDGHPALASASAIAEGSAASIADDYTPVPERAEPPSTPSTLAAVQAARIPPATVAAAMDWLQNGSRQSAAELSSIDAEDRAVAQGELHALWGDQYSANVQQINRFLATQIEPDAAAVFLHARGPDGRAFANDPAYLQRLLGAARQSAPALGGGLDADLASIASYMKTNRASYSKNEPLQARHRELLRLKHGGA